jgi:hypothetical protein
MCPGRARNGHQHTSRKRTLRRAPIMAVEPTSVVLRRGRAGAISVMLQLDPGRPHGWPHFRDLGLDVLATPQGSSPTTS